MMELTGDMRQRIIDAAVRQIETEGEASLRLRDIASVVGIAGPSLFHYFANREELVVAAQAERYRRSVAVANPFVVAAGISTNRTEFIAAVRETFAGAFLPERRVAREIRAEILGSSIHRPNLYNEVAEMTHVSLEEGVRALRRAQESGWLRSDIDVEVFCLWIFAQMSSIIYAEMRNDDRFLRMFKQIGLEALNKFLMD